MTTEQKFNATIVLGFATVLLIAGAIAIYSCIALLTLSHI